MVLKKSKKRRGGQNGACKAGALPTELRGLWRGFGIVARRELRHRNGEEQESPARSLDFMQRSFEHLEDEPLAGRTRASGSPGTRTVSRRRRRSRTSERAARSRASRAPVAERAEVDGENSRVVADEHR